MRYLITRVFRLTTKKIRYTICMWAYMISNIASDLVNVYLLLWLSRFVDEGILPDQDSAKSIFEEIIFYSGISMIIGLPLIGLALDRLPA